jgi:hypothetical protein
MSFNVHSTQLQNIEKRNIFSRILNDSSIFSDRTIATKIFTYAVAVTICNKIKSTVDINHLSTSCNGKEQHSLVGYYSFNYRPIVRKIIGEINEITIFDVDEALELVLSLFLSDFSCIIQTYMVRTSNDENRWFFYERYNIDQNFRDNQIAFFNENRITIYDMVTLINTHFSEDLKKLEIKLS